MTSRRKFLTGAAKFGAAAAFSTFPPSIQRALAIPANSKHGTIEDVEHIVIVMQENRSFDQYFGTLAGVRGFGDRFTIPLPGGLSVWQQKDARDRVILPYHLDSQKGNAQRVSGTNHSWADGQDAWDGGRMYRWPRFKDNADSRRAGLAPSMGYLKERELPFQFALANAFTICDAYHCSMHAGTNSNRLFHWTGTNGPTGANVATVINEWDEIDGPSRGYDWKTYPERLQESGVSWMVYQNMPDNFTDNPLSGFKQYRHANQASGKPVKGSGVSPAYDPTTDDAANPLYKGIANTMPDGGFLERFRADVQASKLAQVTWIIPPATYSEHPGPSSPVQGGWYIQDVLDALTANPQVWSKTVLLINFDENDGYFDHVPAPAAPSVNPDGTPAGKTTLHQEALAPEYFTHPNPPGTTSQPRPDGRVYGPGVRVPMYVISPWSRGGWVNSEVFDHTSVLRFLEARFGVMEPNISAFRRAVCGDLTSAFNFASPNEQLPFLAGRTTRAGADQLRNAQQRLRQIRTPTDQQMPRQAVGVRPSRALAYELHLTANVDTSRGKVQLLMANAGSAGVVLHVYDRLHLDRFPRRYMVEAGKSLDDVWDIIGSDDVLDVTAGDRGLYDLWVLGPNGYHRHFKGNLTTASANPEILVRYIASGKPKLHMELHNLGRLSCTFTVQAKAYSKGDAPRTETIKPGKKVQIAWDLSDSGGWYDFAVTCDADETFYRRLAGRVETGKHSISDPAIGLEEVSGGVSYDALKQWAEVLAIEIAELQGTALGTATQKAQLAQLAELAAQLRQNIDTAAPDANLDEAQFLADEFTSLQNQFTKLAVAILPAGGTFAYP